MRRALFFLPWAASLIFSIAAMPRPDDPAAVALDMMAGCELELLLDVCCIVVSLCLSSDGSRCGSFSFVAFVAAIWPMLFCKLAPEREPSLCL